MRPVQHGVRSGAATSACGRRRISLSACIAEPATAFGFGTTESLFRERLQAYRRPCFEAGIAGLPIQHRVAFQVWQQLPVLATGSVLDELFLFVDGSFAPQTQRAAWSLVALGRVGQVVGKLGFLDNFTRHAKPSAYAAELEALLHAEALAASLPCPVIHVASDCQSALQVVQGTAKSEYHDVIGRAALGLHFANRLRPTRIFRHKVSGHDGCAFNELADCVAKSFACAGSTLGAFDPGTDFWEAVIDGTL